MISKLSLPLLAASLTLASCGASNPKPVETASKPVEATAIVPSLTGGPLDTATFAGGCFWCEEGIFEKLAGVTEAVSGYSGGKTKNPTYRDVCSHTTGHAETVQVYYDPAVISYQTLLEVYFRSMDPTQVNGQGHDLGDSYRSVIFYKNQKEKELAEAYKKKLDESGEFSKPIAVLIQPLEVFYKAEEYHQDYVRNNPDEPYVRAVSKPRIGRMADQFGKILKQ